MNALWSMIKGIQNGFNSLFGATNSGAATQERGWFRGFSIGKAIRSYLYGEIEERTSEASESLRESSLFSLRSSSEDADSIQSSLSNSNIQLQEEAVPIRHQDERKSIFSRLRQFFAGCISSFFKNAATQRSEDLSSLLEQLSHININNRKSIEQSLVACMPDLPNDEDQSQKSELATKIITFLTEISNSAQAKELLKAKIRADQWSTEMVQRSLEETEAIQKAIETAHTGTLSNTDFNETEAFNTIHRAYQSTSLTPAEAQAKSQAHLNALMTLIQLKAKQQVIQLFLRKIRSEDEKSDRITQATTILKDAARKIFPEKAEDEITLVANGYFEDLKQNKKIDVSVIPGLNFLARANRKETQAKQEEAKRAAEAKFLRAQEAKAAEKVWEEHPHPTRRNAFLKLPEREHFGEEEVRNSDAG